MSPINKEVSEADDSPDDNIEDNPADETQEDSEEQSEETEDSSDTAEDETESDDSSEEGEKPYIDIASLPPELKEIGKRMLASHTKSAQKIKQDYAALEEQLTDKYSQAILKANALDALGANTHFQAFMADVIEHGRPYGYSSQFRNGNEEKESEESPEGLDKNGIQKLIDEAVSKAVKPFQDERTLTTFNAVSKLPFFTKNKPQITELVQKFNLPLDKAYELATAEDRAKAALEEKSKKAKDEVKILKKLPRTEKPSSGGTSPALSKKTVQTIREAVSLAWDKQTS